MHPSVLELPFSPATPVGRRQYLGPVTYHSWTYPGVGCWQLSTSESPDEGRIAIYDIAGTYLSTRLLFSSALASVLPPIDRGDVPSPLGVLDGVWWRDGVCAALMLMLCAALCSLASVGCRWGSSHTRLPVPD